MVSWVVTVTVVILAKSRYTGRNLVMFNDYTYYYYLQVQLHESSSKRRMWNQQNMVNAIKDLRAGIMGLKKAVQVYSVPKTTLRRFVHSNYTAEEAVKIYVELLPTRSGNYTLRFGNNTYWCNWYKNTNTVDKPARRWYCSKRKVSKCHASVKTLYGRIVAIYGDHNH
ncbi:unnamed protein product [Chilo suppressalis]|uniref:HTH psq-type domain-containing protein n=1 Tax=Chilo suppressalis TaxID=168631 RepID=A0ABN8AV47_CHISP|nr:unnamed protein product [Chilo suppressalis]